MYKFLRVIVPFVFSLLLFAFSTRAQTGLGMGNSSAGAPGVPRQQEYELGGITVTGAKYLDEDLLQAVTGLTVGQKIKLPNDEAVAKALRNLWKQELFSDISITVTRFIGDKVFLNIAVEERPKLGSYTFRGIKKSESSEIKDKLSLVAGRVVTEGVKQESINRIKKYYTEKGYGAVKVSVKEINDPAKVNSIILVFTIDKGGKTHINQVNIAGNTQASDAKLKSKLKSTKEKARITLHPADEVSVYDKSSRSFKKYLKNFGFLSLSKTLEALDPYFRYNFFSSSKFSAEKFEEDKQSLVTYYNSLGYRDAAIESDTIYTVKNGDINIDLKVKEGRRYYFGDITWRGNTKYTNEQLAGILGIKKGSVFNQELLDSRIGKQVSPEGGEDVSSLYMDDGYLFFNIEPVEASVVGDTINYEMRITEGQQATINNVTITGNDRTNEHVIRRELRTLPGSKFSRAALIRTQREIANLGYFDQEKIGIQPKPHPENGTVDIEYSVVEKSSDQLQLSAGFGGGVSFYGNVGVTFNNFSARNIFHPKLWDPLPVGDGQKFSINFVSNGSYYNSLSTSFTEPWLGGKRPNALTTSFSYSKISSTSTANSYLAVVGGAVSISKRLKVPDDNFILTVGLNYQRYTLNDYTLVSDIPDFTTGTSNNLYLKIVLARYSVDQPLYPRSGSNISLTMQFSPPYSSLSGKDYTGESSAEKFKWVESHRYRFVADWYQKITGNLVFKLSTKYGFMGYYNKAIGYSPFDRFQLGGDGLSGYSYFVGRDIISQRGYDVYQTNGVTTSAVIFNKYSAEIRYPFSLSPTSTIFALAFVDAANAWTKFSDYNPFKLNRDAGVGVRIFLPMFGLLGLDYGFRFNQSPGTDDATTKLPTGKFTFMLGFEPD